MTESLSKFFRKPEDDVKVRNQGSFTDEEVSEIKNDFAEEVLRRYLEQQKSSLSLEEELGEDIHEKIELLLDVVTHYFSSLGFTDIKFDPFLFFQNEFDEKSTGSSSRLDGTLVYNTDVNDVDIKQMQFLKTLTHELYHSTAAVSLTVKSSFPTPDHLEIHMDIEQGAGYRPTGKKNELRALEEGLAAEFELLIFEEIKKLYANESVLYYDKLVSEAFERVDKDICDKNDISIVVLTENYLQWSESHYKASRELVRFLSEQIIDFNRLVEGARIKRNPLPLARAIEAKFGQGSYRKITTAQDTEAYQLLSEFSSK